jgi:hypothetical protein
VHKNEHAMRKSHGHISWVRALVFMLFKEDPSNLYKIESALESDKWSLNSWHWNVVYFSKLYTIYIEKEQIPGPKKHHAMRKSHGHISWVRALGFKRLALEYGVFSKIFTIYIEKEQNMINKINKERRRSMNATPI